jgi:hypothetical protein
MRCFVVCFRCSPAHQRQSGSQRELGSGRQGRHGDDAEQDRTRGAALQALLRGPRRHGECAIATPKQPPAVTSDVAPPRLSIYLDSCI